jgi:hypothetical protein
LEILDNNAQMLMFLMCDMAAEHLTQLHEQQLVFLFAQKDWSRQHTHILSQASAP